MPKTSVHDVLIHLMVLVSASDRDMTDQEMGRIGTAVRSWPVFEDFDEEKIIDAARGCQVLLAEQGLDAVLDNALAVIPQRLHDTAYALCFDVAAVDLEMRMEEMRILQMVRERLRVDADAVAAIERAAKARSRTLT